MPVLTPYMISWASIFFSSMARQALMRLERARRQFHFFSVARHPHHVFDGQA